MKIQILWVVVLCSLNYCMQMRTLHHNGGIFPVSISLKTQEFRDIDKFVRSKRSEVWAANAT